MKSLLSSALALALAVAASLPSQLAHAQEPAPVSARVAARVGAEYPALFELYKELHARPELSFYEEKTAARLAAELRQTGFEVTTKIGGHGIVAVLKNGPGPTVLLRTDLDGLPVKEMTGLPYASQHRVTDAEGNEVNTMHACGHDIHMTALAGAARVLHSLKDRWQGTLVLIGQPAEERGGGAKAMLADGLFTRFPKPDFCIALHVGADQPAGTIGYIEGFALANVDAVDVTIRGVGGHGAFPQMTRDPIVLAAQTILALQTIVSREVAPGEPAVVTVGSIHGGTKHNIIPEEVRLQLTLRSFTDEVREKNIAAVRRITRGLALAAGLPEDRMPIVKIGDEFTPATYNHPEFTRRLVGVFQTWLGAGNVIPRKPVMGGEDFSRYGRTEDKIPISIFWLGAVNPDVVRDSLKAGKSLPSLHSSLFAPAPEPTIKTGVTALTAAVLELLGKK